MRVFHLIQRLIKHIKHDQFRGQFKHISETASISLGTKVYAPDNLYMGEHTNIDGGVIMNTRAKLIMKKNSGAAIGLLAVTGNHLSVVGMNLKQVTDKVKDELDIFNELDKDIIVEEDVWIASNVTLLSGSRLGRGCEIGSGSVVRGNVPPYSVVIGNPCKVVGFRFTPEEIVEHEEVQYGENERLPMDLLQRNYEKYYLKRIKEIKQFTKL